MPESGNCSRYHLSMVQSMAATRKPSLNIVEYTLKSHYEKKPHEHLWFHINSMQLFCQVMFK